MTPITYEQWNTAIAEKIYCGANRDRPVYLQVDDELLAEIGVEFGLSPQASRESFVHAVRMRAALDRMPLEKFFHCRRWENDTSKPPPFIGFLGFCVLAAFDMERDSSQSISAANYYKRFETLLGTKRPSKFDDVHELWERLNRWLDEDLGGKFGRATARYVNNRHVGYPISQALLRQTNRNKLPLLYERCSLEPNEENISAEFFQTELQQWSQLETFPFDSRFKRLFEREDNHTIHEVAQMILAEYQAWDGRTADEIRGGVATANITLHLESDYDTCHLTLFPPVQSGNGTPFPEACYQQNQRYYTLTHDIILEQWFNPLPNEPFLQQILAGQSLELVHKQFKLRLNAKPLLLFQKDEGELGHWVYTASRPELHTTYHLLCHPKLFTQLQALLDQCATVGQTVRLSNPLYKEWIWLRDVTFMREVQTEDELLRSIAPKPPQPTLKLRDGLKLGRSRYLQGGEPCLEITGLPQPTTLFIDDAPYGEIEQTQTAIDLSQLNLSVGTHTIRLGQDGAVRRFHIVQSGHQPAQFTPLAHTFEQENDTIRAHQFALSTMPDTLQPSEIAVSGGNIIGGVQVSLAITHPVWVRCGNYTRCFIIGRYPHQIIEYRLPKTTKKLNIIFPVLFKPQWILYAQGNKCRVFPVGTPLSPIQPTEPHENHRKWVKWVRNAKPPKRRLGRVWRTYCKVAIGLR